MAEREGAGNASSSLGRGLVYGSSAGAAKRYKYVRFRSGEKFFMAESKTKIRNHAAACYRFRS